MFTSAKALLDAWVETRARGSAPAIYAENGGVLRTFAEIEEESQALAALLGEVPEGTVVGVQIGNHAAWPALVLALFRRGLIPLPLGRHMEDNELRQALRTCGARALVALTGDALQVNAEDHVPPVWPPGPTPDFLKLTSGTTSAPRAVRFRAAQLVADCDNICRSMGITEDDVSYGVIPISHSYGFSHLLTPLLCCGVRLVVSDDRMPRAILAGLAATKATVFPGMPVFYDKLAALEAGALPHLRLCISAGAPLLPSVAEAFTRRYGLRVHTFYGSSECGGIGYDDSEGPGYEEGFVGRPMHGVAINAEAEGRIAICGAAVADGYFPDAEPEVLDGERFLPGDLIRWSDGGMYLAGRASDLINIAGRKLNPAEIEAQLAQFPGVRQVVVFSVPSRLRGEEPVACVAGENLQREELQRYCEEHLSQWQRPRDLWLVPEIQENERGKISRRALAARYLALEK